MTCLEVVATKVCSLCRLEKVASEFHRHPLGKDGLQARCKLCALDVAREHYNANREAKLAYQKSWQEANPEKATRNKRSSLLKKYGITPEEYEARLESQGGVCAICATDDPGRGRKYFAVDHDHVTGAVRGLLCMKCNDGLGRFKDDVELLMLAARYLGADF